MNDHTTTTATTTYSVSYMETLYEGGILTFSTWEEMDQWFEEIGYTMRSVIFH
jgi:hypothetical protein